MIGGSPDNNFQKQENPEDQEGVQDILKNSGEANLNILKPREWDKSEVEKEREESMSSDSAQLPIYVGALENKLEDEFFEKLKEKFRDKTLIDIGAGSGHINDRGYLWFGEVVGSKRICCN
jgi:hypothetical protein